MPRKKTPSVLDVVKDSLGMFADMGVNVLIGNVKSATHDVVSDARAQVEKATIHVLKSATIFLIMILGFVMTLVGLGEFLNNTVPALAFGLGTVVVGLVLLVLGLVIQFFKS